MPAGRIAGGRAGGVREDHDREFEPFCLMYGQHANTLSALLDDGSVLSLTCFCILIHALGEGAKRGGAALFEPPGQVDHPQAVRQGLLSCGPHRNACMCPNRVQQHQNRLGDWATIASHMQPAQENKGVGHFLDGRVELRALNRMHRMEPTYLQLTIRAESLPIEEQGVVAESE